MDIGKRVDIVVFFLVIFLAYLIGNNAIYKYNLNKVDAIKAQIEEEKKKNEILGIVGILDRKLQPYQKRSFSTTEITQLLDKITQLAKESGIEIKTFNPLTPAYRDEYIELPLQIPIRCEYHQLGQFLGLIESNQEFIWVKSLKMQKSTVTRPGQANIPKIDLTVSGLYLKK